MTGSSPNRLDRIEAAIDRQVQVNAELFSSVRSLVGTVEQYQENFMVIVQELRTIRSDMQVLQTRHDEEIREIREDIRSLQTENNRILNQIEQRHNE